MRVSTRTRLLSVQEQKVANLDPHPDTSLQKCLCLTELARVKYLLRCYYRTRLRKVLDSLTACDAYKFRGPGLKAVSSHTQSRAQVETFTMSLLDTADTSDPAGPTHHLLSPKELTYAQVQLPDTRRQTEHHPARQAACTGLLKLHNHHTGSSHHSVLHQPASKHH